MRRSALLLLFGAWAVGLVGLSPAVADTDVGNIAVIETDPTILQPGELFDLNNRSLTFTPRSGGGYTVGSGTLNFDSNTGTNLNLGDNASVKQSLAFTFPFFGVNRTSVFINTNGNLTFSSGSTLTHFNSGSVTSLGSDLSAILDRIAGGVPRIAVLWQDWNPAAGGGVFANSLSDRLIVTWSGVPLFNTATTATFQVILFSTGVIRMNYQNVTTTPGGGYLVGISPGASGQFLTTAIDFSQGGSSISSFPTFEPLVQVFGSSSGPLVHIPAVARRFFNTHTDVFDQFVMFANFTHAMGNAFAFELEIRQTVSGINLSLFNRSSFFGSSGRLQSFLNMNRLGVYSDDLACLQNPTCRSPDDNDSALTVMGQESGHMWLAYPKFDDSGVCSTLLLGRDLAHWSFFHDTDASVMEGNSWVDNSNGTFTTDEDTLRYSALDQYIMGLRSAASVPTFFFINNPTNTGGRTSSSTPQTGVTVNGIRQNVTVNQIQTCHGARSPSSGFTAVNPTTTWNQAFILLIPGGTAPPQADLTKIDTIRAAWQSYFGTATGGRGSVNTTLPTGPVTPPAVTTTAATGVGPTGATLNGTVNPNGSTTTAFFQYGLTTGYGLQTGNQGLGAGTTVQAVSAVIGSLQCNTPYHFRAVASNAGGPINGADQTFTTVACPVTPPTTLLPGFPADYDGDGKTDIAVYRPSTGTWYIINSAAFTVTAQQWGAAGHDIPVPGDYDGDGKDDITAYRPSTGFWFIIQSSNGAVRAQQWGAGGDVPMPGDYDGDGKTDIAVYRPSTGTWFIINSSTGGVRSQQWGAGGDRPVPGDYDGDHRTDIAVYRPSTGVWYIINSSTGGVTAQQWGAAGDIPVPGDYDGDGKTDIAVYRPSTGTWFIINSSTGAVRTQHWGAPGDVPVPGDYDGDGKTDIAVYRPSTGVWFIIRSSTGSVQQQQWGAGGDQPLPEWF